MKVNEHLSTFSVLTNKSPLSEIDIKKLKQGGKLPDVSAEIEKQTTRLNMLSIRDKKCTNKLSNSSTLESTYDKEVTEIHLKHVREDLGFIPIKLSFSKKRAKYLECHPQKNKYLISLNNINIKTILNDKCFIRKISIIMSTKIKLILEKSNVIWSTD